MMPSRKKLKNEKEKNIDETNSEKISPRSEQLEQGRISLRLKRNETIDINERKSPGSDPVEQGRISLRLKKNDTVDEDRIKSPETEPLEQGRISLRLKRNDTGNDNERKYPGSESLEQGRISLRFKKNENFEDKSSKLKRKDSNPTESSTSVSESVKILEKVTGDDTSSKGHIYKIRIKKDSNNDKDIKCTKIISDDSKKEDVNSDRQITTGPYTQATETNISNTNNKEDDKSCILENPPLDESSFDKKEINENTIDDNKDIPKPEQKWQQGERILCFHGPLIYEAKIQQVEVMNGIPKYFIHYKGWNKNWDEWVPEARMLKYAESNVSIQKDLCRAHEVKEQGKKKKQAPGGAEHVFAVPKAPSPVPKKKESGGRRKSGLKPKRREENQSDVDFLIKNGKEVKLRPPDSSVESEEQFRSKLEIKIKIPEELKSYIVDDWLQISRKKKLCVLPAKITADQMISEYTRAKTLNKADKLKNNKEMAIIEVTAGVREYFNVMLATQLLYKQERTQYEQMVRDEPNMVPCKVYGVVHLLRLFTKLGEMLIYTPLSEKSISLLLFYLHDMLGYMKKNASLLFSLADYGQDPAA